MESSRRLTGLFVGCLTVWLTFGCAAGTGSDLQTARSTAGTDPRGSAVIESASGTLVARAGQGSCSRGAAPPGSVPWANLDEAGLAARGKVSRLTAEAGDPLSVVAVDTGAVVLGANQDFVTKPSADGSSTSEMTKSDLVVQRVRDDGTTVWSVRLGVVQPWYGTGAHQLMASDGQRIWIVWPRFDGTMPTPYDAMDTGPIVRSTLDINGALLETTELRDHAPPTQAIGSAFQSPVAVAADGSTVLGTTDSHGFNVERFDGGGKSQWVRSLPGSASQYQPFLALAEGQVVASFGQSITSWNPDGTQRWARPDTASAVAAVQNVNAQDDVKAPAVVVSASIPGRDGVCVLDSFGNVISVATVDRTPTKGWWTDHGLLLLDQTRATGTDDSLAFVNPDGTTPAEIGLAGSGDIAGVPGSSVADITRAQDGRLLVVGSESDYKAGTHDPNLLENWRFFWILPSPIGDGDLSAVPTTIR